MGYNAWKLITPSNLLPIVFPAVAIAFVLIFVARPVAVLFSLLLFHFPWRKQIFISWCGLRGAVPIILALFPSLAGLEHTETYFELVFFVVLISLALQGWTISPMAKWMQIEVPPTLTEPECLHLTIKHEHDKELLIYPVLEGSYAAGSMAKRLPMTEGSQVVGVIHKGILVDWLEQHNLIPEDQVMILATISARPTLARFFAPASSSPLLGSERFFGGFEVDLDNPELTVEEYLVKQFQGKPIVGDQV